MMCYLEQYQILYDLLNHKSYHDANELMHYMIDSELMVYVVCTISNYAGDLISNLI